MSFFVAAAPREKEKLNERKENKFYESFSIFFCLLRMRSESHFMHMTVFTYKKQAETFDKT